MHFLAQAIADLVTIVTFQQRRPPAPVPEPDDLDETSWRLRSSTLADPETPRDPSPFPTRI